MTSYREALDFSRMSPWLTEQMREGIVEPCLKHMESVGLQVEVSDDLWDCRRFWTDHLGTEDMLEFPAFDAQYHGKSGNGLIITKDGKAIGQVWRRLVPLWDAQAWHGQSLEEAINSGYLLYGDHPAPDKASTSHCNSALARSIRCSSPLLGGAVYILKDYRRHHTFSALSRLSRLYAVAMLQPWHDFILAVCSANPNGGAGNLSFRSFGVTRLEDGVQWNNQRYLIGHATLEETVKILLDTAGKPLDEPFAQQL